MHLWGIPEQLATAAPNAAGAYVQPRLKDKHFHDRRKTALPLGRPVKRQETRTARAKRIEELERWMLEMGLGGLEEILNAASNDPTLANILLRAYGRHLLAVRGFLRRLRRDRRCGPGHAAPSSKIPRPRLGLGMSMAPSRALQFQLGYPQDCGPNDDWSLDLLGLASRWRLDRCGFHWCYASSRILAGDER